MKNKLKAEQHIWPVREFLQNNSQHNAMETVEACEEKLTYITQKLN